MLGGWVKVGRLPSSFPVQVMLRTVSLAAWLPAGLGPSEDEEHASESIGFVTGFVAELGCLALLVELLRAVPVQLLRDRGGRSLLECALTIALQRLAEVPEFDPQVAGS